MKWQYWVKLALQAIGNVFARCVCGLVVAGFLWADGYLYWPPDALCLATLGFVLFVMFSPFRKKRQKQQTQDTDGKPSSE